MLNEEIKRMQVLAGILKENVLEELGDPDPNYIHDDDFDPDIDRYEENEMTDEEERNSFIKNVLHILHPMVVEFMSLETQIRGGDNLIEAFSLDADIDGNTKVSINSLPSLIEGSRYYEDGGDRYDLGYFHSVILAEYVDHFVKKLLKLRPYQEDESLILYKDSKAENIAGRIHEKYYREMFQDTPETHYALMDNQEIRISDSTERIGYIILPSMHVGRNSGNVRMMKDLYVLALI